MDIDEKASEELEQKSQETGNVEKAWQDTITDDLKEHPSIAKFVGKTPGDLFKSYTELEKMIGRDKIVFPKSDVEFTELYGKLGRPDTADEYKLAELELPKGLASSDDATKEFKNIAHELNLTQKQLDGIHQWYWKNQSSQFSDIQTKAEAELSNTTAELKKEYGLAYSAKLEAANRAIQEFGGDELIELMDKSGLGRNPTAIKAFVNIGSKLLEESHLAGGEGRSNSPQAVQDQITKLMRSPDYTSSDATIRQAAVRKVSELYTKKMSQVV